MRSFVQAGVHTGYSLSCCEERDGIYREPPPCRDRLIDAERGKGRVDQFLEPDRRLSLLAHRLRKRGPLTTMSFILTPARVDRLFAAIAHKFEMAKIFENCGAASAEHFDALLGERPVAIREIADGSLGAIAKTKRDQHIVATVAARIADRPGLDFDNWRSRKKHQKIDEVANLAENAAASPLSIDDPMVGRKLPGIDPIMQRQRFRNRREEGLHPRRHGREAAVESDHQRRTFRG